MCSSDLFPSHDRVSIGIAMGTGTDVAMNSAQVTLVKGDLRGIEIARSLSEATIKNMKCISSDLIVHSS